MNLFYIAGFAAGVITVAIVITVINLLYKKKHGRKKPEYDERQETLRGRAYKAAYFTLLFYLILNGLVVKGFGLEWAENLTGSFIGLSISIGVFVIKCIKDDAYISLSEKPVTYLVLFSIVGFINLGVSIFRIVGHKSFMTDGLLNDNAINLTCGILFTILAAVMAVKMIKDSRSGNKDGEV